MSVNVYSNNSNMNQLAMSKDLKKKFTKTFDLSQIAEDPMDCYLDTLGLWKKRIARDGSCLFRAVAEQIYPCQLHHDRVRKECIQYMSDNRDVYTKYVTSISFDDYLQAMKNPFEYAGQLEIAAMSKLYRRDFFIYHHPDQTGIDVTQNGFDKKIYLCYSYNNHFDAIFTKVHRDNLALIQSLVYEILYDKVFGSGEQVSVARRLLRKSDTIYPKEYMKHFENGIDFDEEDEEAESAQDLLNEVNQELKLKEDNYLDENNNENLIENNQTSDDNDDSSDDKKEKSDDNKSIYKLETSVSSCSSDKNNSQIQKMPLPYKVAKSLDPVIYRNTAFDAWLAAKKEFEETLNQKAVSALQSGDKCLVKLNNNYSEKWNLAYVHTIQHDLANVFVVELNENHCVPLENVKPYTSGNDMPLMLHQHYHHNQHYGPNYLMFNPNMPLIHINNVKNVQKLVQSINTQFSKIFISTDNKRRNNLKKKQFALKKSSSFHAFSTDLPTLMEVEEQLEDAYGYNSHHYYFNEQQNHAFNMQATYNHLTPFMPNPHHNNRQQITHSQTYYSLPPSNLNDQKMNTSKMTTSVSANNLNNVNKNPQLPTSQSCANSLATPNKNNLLNQQQQQQTPPNNKVQRRNQRFNQQSNIGSSFENNNNNNFGFNNNKNQWPNQFNSNQFMPTQHHAIQPPLMGVQNQSFNSFPNMNLSSQNFMPPPPPMPPIQQPLNMHQASQNLPLPPPQFMHGPPLPPIAPQLGINNNQSNQQQRNFFNPNSNYMFNPPNHDNNGYYFPPQPQPNNQFNNNGPNYNKFNQQNNQQPRKNDFNNNINNNKNDYQPELQSNSFQQSNTSNYLLMPAPNNNNNTKNKTVNTTVVSNSKAASLTTSIKTETSSFDNNITSNLNGLSRSHSYHSGVSAQSYDLSNNNNNTNNSNVYVDVYMPPHHLNSSTNQQDLSIHPPSNNLIMNSTTNTNSTNNSSVSCLNDLNNLMNSNNNYPPVYPSVNSASNLDTTNTTNSYNGTNNFQNYEIQYPRFDNSTNGLIEDPFLLNPAEQANRQQNNLWAKSNKLTKSTSVFSDMSYSGGTPIMPPATSAPADKNSQFCYSNCLVVNIDGPINFNATHSLLDDGSDLPFNDVNTIRFFYNVGIEYYRLNLAAPYNQQNNYSANSCYAPQPPLLPNSLPAATSMPLINTTSTVSTNSIGSITHQTCSNSLPANKLNIKNEVTGNDQLVDTNNHFNSNGQLVPKNGKQQQQANINRRNY